MSQLLSVAVGIVAIAVQLPTQANQLAELIRSAVTVQAPVRGKSPLAEELLLLDSIVVPDAAGSSQAGAGGRGRSAAPQSISYQIGEKDGLPLYASFDISPFVASVSFENTLNAALKKVDRPGIQACEGEWVCAEYGRGTPPSCIKKKCQPRRD